MPNLGLIFGDSMTLLRKLLSTSAVLTFSFNAIASEATDLQFAKLLTKYKVGPQSEQSYCYSDELGVTQGKNIDLQVRLASVSKLLTSLWAMEVLGPDFRFDTKLFIKGTQMHIQGSMDPFMSNEKMLYLVSELNRLGFNHFDKITYDKTVQINPSAQVHTDEYPLITRDSNGKNIKLYFNTASWSKIFKAEYDRLAGLAKAGRFQEEVSFSANEIQFAEKNPFSEEDSEVRVLTLTSPELYKYLKEINVKSNNYASQTLFLKLGGESKLEKFLADRFSLTNEQIKLYNGSGLPSIINGARKDNYATCAIMLNMVSELRESAERQGRELEDIMAVPGNDQGTFRNRLNSSDYRNTFVAKTGTLMHTSTLAGALSTQKGFSFFGVFNQTTDIINAKNVQNEMVSVLMTEMGGPKVFNYVIEGFHTYDGNENVKNLDLLMEEESDFSPIENVNLF